MASLHMKYETFPFISFKGFLTDVQFEIPSYSPVTIFIDSQSSKDMVPWQNITQSSFFLGPIKLNALPLAQFHDN